MKLKRLVIQGFKSFKDRTTVNFDKGITGIVGPNGCGKSNIVDALFWVMGEQSAKHLRGTSMKDIIFAGSDKYPPASFAEVILVLENTRTKHIHIGHKLLSPSEIALTRKLYSNGETEYRINGEHCRMRDIQEVFMDTGAGPKAYSIIAQGEIDRLVQVRPEERKSMIEEVAGVTKFKLRRRDSLKKIEQTRYNLERIEDLRREIEKNLKSLKKQSERAARAKILKQNIEKSELLVNSHHIYSHLKSYCESLQSMQEKRLDLENWNLQKKSLEISLEGERHLRDEKKSHLEARLGHCHEISEKLATGKERVTGLEGSLLEKEEQIQTRIQEATEFQKELEERRVRLSQLKEDKTHLNYDGGSEEEFQLLEKKVGEMKRQLERDENQLERFSKTLESLKQKKDDIEQNIFKNQSRLKETEINLTEGHQEMTFLKDNHTRLTQGLSLLEQAVESSRQKESQSSKEEQMEKQSLQELERCLEEKRTEQRILLDKLAIAEAKLTANTHSENKAFLAENKSENLELLQNLLESEDRWKPAITALLGELAQSIVHPSLQNFPSSDEGKTLTFIQPDAPAALLPTNWEMESLDSIHPLETLVTLPENWRPVLSPLLKGFYIAENLSDELLCALPSPTPFKALASQDGTIVIKNIHGFKVIRINGSKLALERERWKKESAQFETSIDDLKNQILAKKDHYETIRSELENARTDFAAKNSLLDTKQDNVADIIQRMDALQDKQEKLSELKVTLQQKKEFFNKSLSEIENQIESNHADLTELKTRQGSLKNAYDREKEKFLTEQVKFKSLDERLQLLNSQIDDIEQQITKQQTRLDNTRELVEKRKREVVELKTDIDNLNEANKSVEQELKKEEIESTLLKEDFEKLLQNMEERENEVKHFAKNINTNEKELISLKAEQERHIHDEVQITRNIFEKYRIDLRDSVGRHLGYDQDTLSGLSDIQNMYVMETPQGSETIIPLPWMFTPLEKDIIKEQETEFKSSRDELASLGEINWQALNDHEKQKVRYDFLKEQETQLLVGLEDLENAIGHIDEKSRQRFVQAFEQVNERFQKVFPIVFGGGNARLVLKGDAEDEQCGVEIIAQPPGKKMQNINLMSGGEKAMTAVILIFSIFLVRPSPFCLLDEVDAPLDDANVGRFNDILKEMSGASQFILVTHNKKTMELNNTLYGVTMQEPGVSKAVSVQLH